ncbi:GNAT family N-acetyltransferase [Candidatus Dojkabacteria bacterium]|uniref:GNAT family N-acetyltransferase n=1 Tax=Candidatus Dojkabacteria bacterium TaxID=2099670 RepID=A0A955L8X3_9BACT|nr:GNAT family N-acetyltransferase [Candidatus Dojkabacteria bacterium]
MITVILDEEFDRNELSKLVPGTFFSSIELIEAYKQAFDLKIQWIVHHTGEVITAALPVETDGQNSYSLGHHPDHDVFDYIPVFYRSVEDFVALLANISSDEYEILELPVELLRSTNHSLKLEHMTTLPVCETKLNPTLSQGKIIFKKKYRRELKRKTNKVTAEFTPVFREVISKDFGLPKLLEFFRQSHNEEKQEFLTKNMEKYVEYFVMREDVSLTGYFFDERLVSVAIYFDKNGTRYLYNMASDTDYYDYSPGILHIYDLVLATIEAKMETFSFLRGDERYKFEIGANACRANYKLL